MQAIKAGDVYFLKSPIKMADPAQEKRLAYLLTTVSSRPAVVIRPPAWWDDFSTVTVLPALTDAKNAITFHMQDRYGTVSESTYPVTPHTPHSVHVSRLGRYIGSLDSKELEELLYAFKWIHDPIMQQTDEVPRCYRNVAGSNVIIPKARNRKPQRTPFIYIDNDSVLHINDSTGMKYDIAKPIEGIPTEVNSTDTYVYHEADSSDAESEAVKVGSSVVVGTGRFPASIFDETDLYEVANRFDIEPAYYEGIVKKRDIKCLTHDELDVIMHNLSPAKVQVIIDLYNSMQPVDALLFGPHLPIRSLCQLCRFSVNEAYALKRLCCTLRDMTESDYNDRMTRSNKDENFIPNTVHEATHDKDNVIMLARDQKDIQNIINRLRPYLSSKQLCNLPRSHYEDFLRCPAHAIRRSFRGAGYQTAYTTEYARIKKIVGKEVR